MKSLNMTFTGERFVPEIEGDIFLEHFHRYYAISSVVNQKVVLDIACGEGYGTELISKSASKVFGVDISNETIKHAQQKYQKDNIQFCVGSTSKIPFEDDSFDIVVSFETIEHHDEHEQMMLEIKRVLKADGMLIISSPEKTNYNSSLKKKNEFHVKELEYIEFKELIEKHFSYNEFYFQNNIYGSILINERSKDFTLLDHHETEIRNILNPKYDLCFASDFKIESSISSFLIGNHVIKTKIESLENQILNMEKSLTWKIGRFFLSPFSWLKKK